MLNSLPPLAFSGSKDAPYPLQRATSPYPVEKQGCEESGEYGDHDGEERDG